MKCSRRLKGLTTMTNSRFNGWRLEDVWEVAPGGGCECIRPMPLSLKIW